MARHALLFSLLYIFSGFYQPLKAQSTTVFNEERLSLGAGIGVEYAMVGLHVKYFFSDYLGIRGSTDYYFQETLWQLGVEFRVPEQSPKRISPYINLSYGTNSYVELEGFRVIPISAPEMFKENKAFLGLTMGAGIKWDILKKNYSYITVGFNFRFINKEHAFFVENFNSMFGANYSIEPEKLLPAIGFVACFNRKK